MEINTIDTISKQDLMKLFKPTTSMAMRKEIPTTLYKGLLNNNNYSMMISGSEVVFYNNKTYQKFTIGISEYYSKIRTIDKLKLIILQSCMLLNINIDFKKLDKIVDINMTEDNLYVTYIVYDSAYNRKLIEKLKFENDRILPLQRNIPKKLYLRKIAINDNKLYGYNYSSSIDIHPYNNEVYFTIRNTKNGKVEDKTKLTFD